ncbi:hypothetical protein SAMN05421753_103190 [Planctomicrobium piriforme]|uniref:Uncharacterized protein n=1 Tax=Planctomicrobium piriforme TaxID=1576369 RepID=A0A1I3DDA4_9PLAN|nr:hypothetical protein SAMN05421753_103190 [Planctomicrobium piriforme]
MHLKFFRRDCSQRHPRHLVTIAATVFRAVWPSKLHGGQRQTPTSRQIDLHSLHSGQFWPATFSHCADDDDFVERHGSPGRGSTLSMSHQHAKSQLNVAHPRERLHATGLLTERADEL